jgi:hypothetical protein
MDELRRSLLCALSLGLACIVFLMIFGTKLPGSGQLHRWYGGCTAVFFATLVAMMAGAFRGRLERCAWPIVVGGLLGYGAASLTYLVYFGLFEFDLLANTARRLGIVDLLVGTIFIVPLATLSWLLGALSGSFFALSRYLVLHSRPRNEVS